MNGSPDDDDASWDEGESETEREGRRMELLDEERHNATLQLLHGLSAVASSSKPKAGSGGWFKSKDKLNLAGLLEVLDGVVDCPGRIVSRIYILRCAELSVEEAT